MRAITAFLFSLTSLSAFAQSTPPAQVPEPGTWALLAAAGIAAVVIGRRGRK